MESDGTFDVPIFVLSHQPIIQSDFTGSNETHQFFLNRLVAAANALAIHVLKDLDG